MKEHTAKQVAINRKALRDFHVEEKHEAGMVLQGTEVKSLRSGAADMRDAYAQVVNGEIILHNLSISPYQMGGYANCDPKRPRKLLMKKAEIRRLNAKVLEKGLTLIPIRLYFTARGYAKVEIALARGKRQYDKRRAIREREDKRAMDRARKIIRNTM